MREIEFTVYGRPQPAGSKRAFPIRKAGVLTGKVAVADANPRQKDWMQEVRSAAIQALNGDPAFAASEPLIMHLSFTLARPKGHFGTGKNASVAKPSAPAYPTVKPDATKLVRAVEDALTGVLWHDDAQVVKQTAEKWYGSPEKCVVWVMEAP